MLAKRMQDYLHILFNYAYTLIMRTQAVVEHYGNMSIIARELNISAAAVQQWGEIVPYYSATQIHERSGIPLEPEHYGAGGRIRSESPL